MAEQPMGRSRSFREAIERAERAAASDVPVLITGESGTGKEVVARWIHACGARAERPFVAVNATALPHHLLESELFGHERGAFTGADRARPGLFVEASRGTLLIDEIGDLPLALQAKLLRVLQEGELRPLGRDRAVKVDARVVAATHRDLRALVAAGRFREDLYYRVSVFVVELPPLRARTRDVLPLARHLLERHARGAEVELSPEAALLLERHDWPGNVRELENALRHALVLCGGAGAVLPEHLPPAVRLGPVPRGGVLSLRAARESAEREGVLRALAETGGNRAETARRLGLSRQSLHARLRRWGVGPGAGRPGGPPLSGESAWPEAVEEP